MEPPAPEVPVPVLPDMPGEDGACMDGEPAPVEPPEPIPVPVLPPWLPLLRPLELPPLLLGLLDPVPMPELPVPMPPLMPPADPPAPPAPPAACANAAPAVPTTRHVARDMFLSVLHISFLQMLTAPEKTVTRRADNNARTWRGFPPPSTRPPEHPHAESGMPAIPARQTLPVRAAG